jgi:DUF1680 family protein
VPGDLYRFLGDMPQTVTIAVNGKPVILDVQAGYMGLRRIWETGDTIELNLPMTARRVISHENVEANRGRVALERGPLVYCFEWPDNSEGKVRNLQIPDYVPLTIEARPELLGGVVTLKTTGYSFAHDEQGQHTSKEVQLTAIPYYAWAHRGQGEMIVWVARE